MNYPALQLVWSPTGMGSVVHGRSWPVGSVAPVGDGLVFGIEGDVRVRYPVEPKTFCKIHSRDGQLRLTHFRDLFHCAVNGLACEETELPLRHRDLVALPKGPLLRVLESEYATVRSPGLEAAVAAAPHDLDTVQVYRDFLLDHGDPLGERLAKAKGGVPGDDARWLDACATLYESGRLEVGWRWGLAQRVVMRESATVFGKLDKALAYLVALPVMRFLRELVLDVSSDRATIAEGLAALALVPLPPTLTRVSLGDVPVTEKAHTEALLAKAERPVEVGFYSEALLEVTQAKAGGGHKVGDKIQVGPRLELGSSHYASALSRNVLLGGTYLLARDGPRFVLARLLNDAPPPKVNGVSVDRFPLRDGDVVELVDEMTAQFKLIR